MSWLSSLFGRTIDLEYRDRGNLVKKTVSEAQFDALMKKAVAEGNATVHASCTVHILDTKHDGERTENWTIGIQVSHETYERLKHSNGDLYATVHYEEGEPKMHALKKDLWDQVADQMTAISRESAQIAR
jgi:hypothetical protein